MSRKQLMGASNRSLTGSLCDPRMRVGVHRSLAFGPHAKPAAVCVVAAATSDHGVTEAFRPNPARPTWLLPIREVIGQALAQIAPCKLSTRLAVPRRRKSCVRVLLMNPDRAVGNLQRCAAGAA
jgi:hypothetical protein